MSKVIFNDKQIKVLAKNPNVLRVSDKAITYSEEFKNKFIEENSKGILPRKIFEDNGFDIEIIGLKRIEQSAARWRKKYADMGVLGLKDSRKSNSGRPLLRELTAQEEIERLKAKISLLEIENEFLKKLDEIERK
jgi:hypothetical protein